MINGDFQLKNLSNLIFKKDNTIEISNFDYSKSKYYIVNKVSGVQFNIFIKDFGYLAFPCVSSQLNELIIKHGIRVPIKRNNHRLVDLTQTKIWQIPPDIINIESDSWSKLLISNIFKEIENMGINLNSKVFNNSSNNNSSSNNNNSSSNNNNSNYEYMINSNNNINIKLEKMLIYDKGSFSLPQINNSNNNDFGSLYIILPSEHYGGELIINHNGESVLLNLDEFKPSNIYYTAFYNDCEYQVKQILHGYRVCLCYQLKSNGLFSAVELYKNKKKEVEILKQLSTNNIELENEIEKQLSEKEKLIFVLDQDYSSFCSFKDTYKVALLNLLSIKEKRRLTINQGYIKIIENVDSCKLEKVILKFDISNGSNSDIGRVCSLKISSMPISLHNEIFPQFNLYSYKQFKANNSNNIDSINNKDNNSNNNNNNNIDNIDNNVDNNSNKNKSSSIELNKVNTYLIPVLVIMKENSKLSKSLLLKSYPLNQFTTILNDLLKIDKENNENTDTVQNASLIEECYFQHANYIPTLEMDPLIEQIITQYLPTKMEYLKQSSIRTLLYDSKQFFEHLEKISKYFSTNEIIKFINNSFQLNVDIIFDKFNQILKIIGKDNMINLFNLNLSIIENALNNKILNLNQSNIIIIDNNSNNSSNNNSDNSNSIESSNNLTRKQNKIIDTSSFDNLFSNLESLGEEILKKLRQQKEDANNKFNLLIGNIIQDNINQINESFKLEQLIEKWDFIYYSIINKYLPYKVSKRYQVEFYKHLIQTFKPEQSKENLLMLCDLAISKFKLEISTNNDNTKFSHKALSMFLNEMLEFCLKFSKDLKILGYSLNIKIACTHIKTPNTKNQKSKSKSKSKKTSSTPTTASAASIVSTNEFCQLCLELNQFLQDGQLTTFELCDKNKYKAQDYIEFLNDNSKFLSYTDLKEDNNKRKIDSYRISKINIDSSDQYLEKFNDLLNFAKQITPTNEKFNQYHQFLNNPLLIYNNNNNNNN